MEGNKMEMARLMVCARPQKGGRRHEETGGRNATSTIGGEVLINVPARDELSLGQTC